MNMLERNNSANNIGSNPQELVYDESEMSEIENLIPEDPCFDVITYARNAIARTFILDLDRLFFENFDWWKNQEAGREQITSPTPNMLSLLSAIRKLLDTEKPVFIMSEFSNDAIRKAIERIGLYTKQLSRVTTFGKEQLGNLKKSDSGYIETVMNNLGINTSSAVLFADENSPTLEPIISTGIGMTLINKPEGLVQAVNVIIDPSAYQEISYEDLVRSLYIPGKIRIVGITGRAGTGKSTIAKRLSEAINKIGGKSVSIDLDSFFYMSSIERRAWVNESIVSCEQRRYRRNMTNWINYALVNETFSKICAGEHIHLEGLYSMELGGEKVGVLDFYPDPEGFTVILGGSALLDARLKPDLDTIIYINTHETVRRSAIWERDKLRGYSREDYEDRFQLTQQSEAEDCFSQAQKTQVYNSDVPLNVVDNTLRTEKLISLPRYIPQR